VEPLRTEEADTAFLDHEPERWLESRAERLVDCWAKILIAAYHRRMTQAATIDGGIAADERRSDV
jgi:hypothetical protein